MKERLEEERISLKVIEAIAFIVLILLFFILLWIDFRWGKKQNAQHSKQIIFPLICEFCMYYPGPRTVSGLICRN